MFDMRAYVPETGTLRPTVTRKWNIAVFWPLGVRVSHYVPFSFLSCDSAEGSFEGPCPFSASSATPV
uniref:Uncharacterized protein n=1 Tax=Anguilla anguilla TaxID=7936 RepID=A0A0E9RA49_ANGAN